MWMCWVTQKSLTAYADGELGNRTTRRIAGHLRICPCCQSHVKELRQVDHLLHTLPSPVRAPDYWPQAFAGLRTKIRGRPHSPRWPIGELFSTLLENPAQAIIPATMIGAALIQTLTFLGVEEEAFGFVAQCLFP